MLIKKDQDALKAYFEDSSNLKGGHADNAVFAEDINALSEFIKYANKKNIPVTVSGGGTGTTAGRIPFGGTVVSMERFNNTPLLSKDTMSARVQAGVLVEDFKRACEREGLFYPCHPTEKTAFLGGTVATNASGGRSFKYGPTRRYVKRLKMVLANGEIFDIGRGEKILTKKDSKILLNSGLEIRVPLPEYKMPAVKNSAGYFVGEGTDLVDLFIGQEGTLSIITEIGLVLARLPSKILSSFVFFKADKDSWNFAADARGMSKEAILSGGIEALSIEYLDKNALNLLRLKNSNVPDYADAAIFFEQELTEVNEVRAVDSWLNLISKHNASADDTWVAMTEDEAEKFNKLRHSIPESVNEIVKRSGFRKLSTDIAVPEDSFAEMMGFYKSVLKDSGIEHVIFGHIGECHVHVNLLPRSEAQMDISENICMEFVRKAVSLKGTVSAEHGIGKIKHKYLEIMYGRQSISDMARIKKAFDPNCILGLDNIFSKEVLKECRI